MVGRGERLAINLVYAVREPDRTFESERVPRSKARGAPTPLPTRLPLHLGPIRKYKIWRSIDVQLRCTFLHIVSLDAQGK